MKLVDRRKQRLKVLLERLEANEDVAVRDLRNALTENEFNEYKQMWEMQKELKSLGDFGSSAYDELLKKGLFHYNKAESGRFNKIATKNFYSKAESYFEKGLEQLKADVQSDPQIAAAYDRQLDFSAHGNLSPSPVGMPRRVNSKSLDNLSDVIGGVRTTVTKRDLKIRIVKSSLADIENHEEGKEGKVEEVTTETVKSTRSFLGAQEQKLTELRRKLNLALK